VKRTDTSGGASPTWTEYIGGIYERTNTGAVTKYYEGFGRNVAVRDSTGTVTYLLADHLGSTVGALDASGNLISTQKYWPYGALRYAVGSLATDKLYTGQQQEATGALQDATNALGTYFYHARFYSTVTGRFVSADLSGGAVSIATLML
jgi:hypothetical protein